MGVVAKRASMTFYSDGQSHYSHRVRIVLAEKGVSVEILDIDPEEKPEDLADLNPYNSLPTLVDRDLVLYESSVTMEYLDERFPHPPLLPVYPVARAQSRLWIYRIERDWCSLVNCILGNNPEQAALVDRARQELQESLIGIAPIFSQKPYFMSDEFTLVDCCVAPILWRLGLMDIRLPEQAQPLRDYMKRVFERDSFASSVSTAEREMPSAL